jgi:hypothetical protein
MRGEVERSTFAEKGRKGAAKLDAPGRPGLNRMNAPRLVGGAAVEPSTAGRDRESKNLSKLPTRDRRANDRRDLWCCRFQARRPAALLGRTTPAGEQRAGFGAVAAVPCRIPLPVATAVRLPQPSPS